MLRGAIIAGVLAVLGGCPYSGRDPAVADAPPGTPDAADPPDADPSAPDAMADASPDGQPDAEPLPPVTVMFGEQPGADFTGVTTDTFIESASPGVVHGVEAGLWADAGPVTNALLRFDLSALPPGTAVLSAELLLTTTVDSLETGTTQIYPVLQAWAENQATWDNRTTAALWDNAGASAPGSRGPTLVGELVPNVPFSPYTTALDVATIQGWIDDPAVNRGMVLISTSPVGNGVTFSSSDEPTATSRPALRITYQP
jgi:hypothetical protein